MVSASPSAARRRLVSEAFECLGDTERVAISSKEVLRWRDEEIDQFADRPHMAHAAGDPVGPVPKVGRAFLRRPREVSGIASLGALAVFLPVASCPDIRGIRRMHLHELPARAHQPVVVKCEDGWNLPMRRDFHQRGREMVQVADVHDVGVELVQHLPESGVNLGVSIPVAYSGHVHQPESDTFIIGIRLVAYRVVRCERVLLSRKDEDLVAAGKSLRERLRVNLGSRVVPHRVAVDDLHDLHDASLQDERYSSASLRIRSQLYLRAPGEQLLISLQVGQFRAFTDRGAALRRFATGAVAAGYLVLPTWCDRRTLRHQVHLPRSVVRARGFS